MLSKRFLGFLFDVLKIIHGLIINAIIAAYVFSLSLLWQLLLVISLSVRNKEYPYISDKYILGIAIDMKYTFQFRNFFIKCKPILTSNKSSIGGTFN